MCGIAGFVALAAFPEAPDAELSAMITRLALLFSISFIMSLQAPFMIIGDHPVSGRDLVLIIGVVLVFATMLVLFNLAVDVLYRWVDPRIA